MIQPPRETGKVPEVEGGASEDLQPSLRGPLTDEALRLLWSQCESGTQPATVARLVSEVRRLRAMIQLVEEYFEALKDRRPRAADHFASRFLVTLAGLRAEEKMAAKGSE